MNPRLTDRLILNGEFAWPWFFKISFPDPILTLSNTSNKTNNLRIFDWFISWGSYVPLLNTQKNSHPLATLLIRFTRLIPSQPNRIIISYCSRNRKIIPFLANEKRWEGFTTMTTDNKILKRWTTCNKRIKDYMKSFLFLSDIAVRNHFKAILSILIDPMRRKLSEACLTLIYMNNLDGFWADD